MKTTTCGCGFIQINNETEILFCKLHAHAGELREAAMATNFAINHYGKRLTKDFDKGELEAWDRYTGLLKKVLAAANGRKA